MRSHIALAAALVMAPGIAHAQEPAKPRAESPDTRNLKIDEAHRTAPENKPERLPEKKDASAGSSRPPPDTPDTRGVEIDEAHRTSPPNTPERRPRSR